jgi:hypothetical protein
MICGVRHIHRYIVIFFFGLYSTGAIAECEDWTPLFEFQIEDATYREKVIWLSGWTFAFYAVEEKMGLCLPECGYYVSRKSSEILNIYFAKKTISAEEAAEILEKELISAYTCN